MPFWASVSLSEQLRSRQSPVQRVARGLNRLMNESSWYTGNAACGCCYCTGVVGVCRAAAPTYYGLGVNEAGCARRPAWQAPDPGHKCRAFSLLLSTSPLTPSLRRVCTEGISSSGLFSCANYNEFYTRRISSMAKHSHDVGCHDGCFKDAISQSLHGPISQMRTRRLREVITAGRLTCPCSLLTSLSPA